MKKRGEVPLPRQRATGREIPKKREIRRGKCEGKFQKKEIRRGKCEGVNIRFFTGGAKRK